MNLIMKNKKEIYTFNINDEVAVQLTDFGKEILKEFYLQFPKDIRPKVEDKFITELWNLMKIFGKYIFMGMDRLPFKDNIIQIRKRD